ncbi:TROVE domain-containing protein [Kribbella deserti]|uniref:TROVE domain-containing protein n=1 Tax=Kribbella deserti TaxID=1926257 RepID=A0ABV6QNK1_9ACTN
MSKFNRDSVRAATVPSVVRSEQTPSLRTAEGAPGYRREPTSELFLLAISNLVGEQTAYESATERDRRFVELVHHVAVADMDWLNRFLPWLRGTANLRSAPLVAALEATKARLDAGLPGESRQLITRVLQRADEPGEALAYWTSQYGRAIPKPVKRGIADAVTGLYDERALLKYDSPAKPYRFGDVIDLVHPRAASKRQGDLFRHALDRRHGRRNAIPETLQLLQRRADLGVVPLEYRRFLLEDHAVLAAAGMTWESLAGWLQAPLDAAAWEGIMPSMGYMALLRNLRNFDEAGVSDEVAAAVAARLADPAQVARSRQLPMRFLSAYRATSPSSRFGTSRWALALERALSLSLAAVPALPGRTLVLVDRSGSMFHDQLSRKSELTRADAAAVFGTALAARAESADLVEFGTKSALVRLPRGESVLKSLNRFHELGGTNTADAVRRWYKGHDRVVIVTDEQAWAGRGAEPTRDIPCRTPVYTWNLAGYQAGHGPSGVPGRHTFGGLSDAAFGLIPLIEAAHHTDWPF